MPSPAACWRAGPGWRWRPRPWRQRLARLLARDGIVLVMTFNIFPVVYFAVSRSLLASGTRLAVAPASMAPAPGAPSGT
ncbi:hypothetical protein BIT31_26900 [Klebsiella pneumoniae]|nr:hypothetical protein BIT31_26900 [Klebsiella pneumoniae]